MPWKLFVDSRRRIAGARGDSDSDFAIQLPYPLSVSGKCYCDVVILSNSFYTIRAGENDRIYLDELAAQTKRVVTLSPGQYQVYELRDALLAALNNGSPLTGQYRVTYLTATNRFQVDLVNGVAADQFRIWSEAALLANATAWVGLASPPFLTANRPCGFLEGTYTAGSSVQAGTAPNAPDVQPYHQLFLRSSLGGGSNQCLGVNGETDIVRRVVIGNAPANSLITDTHNTAFDYVTIPGSPELNTIWFQLVDVDNKVVNTHGHPLSFSVIFQDVVED